MLSNNFTILELLDLALRVPEVGAVNFNILHTVLTHLILELKLDFLKPTCCIEDEVVAQAAITKGKIEDPNVRRRQSRPTKEIHELKDLLKDAGLMQTGEKPSLNSMEPKIIEDGEISEKDETQDKRSESQSESLDVDSDGSRAPSNQEEKAVARQALQILAEPDNGTSDDSRDLEEQAVAKQALKMLAEEEMFESDPSKVVQEMWRAININRRVDGAEEGLRELSHIIDIILDKVQEMEDESREAIERTKSMVGELDTYFDQLKKFEDNCNSLYDRIDESNQYMKDAISRLEEILANVIKQEEETSLVVQDLSKKYEELPSEEDLEHVRSFLMRLLEDKAKELRKRILQVEDLIIPKDHFMDLLSRTENLDEVKVNREELGRLLDTDFVDDFLEEQSNLRFDVEELKSRLSTTDEDLKTLIRRIDEEILKHLKQSLSEINETIGKMREKLETLDSDDINDSFARLEEQADTVLEELKNLKTEKINFEREAKSSFKKISDIFASLQQLEALKVDKSKLHELLQFKADVEMVSNKLDRDEFISVIRNLKENHDTLAILVKINEEEISSGFRKTRHELSLKMYSEDFITATEPIRHRIKAILYEQKRIKEISLSHLFPDAPGVLKCFSCKREANLVGLKNEDKLTLQRNSSENSKKEALKLPSIDNTSPPEKSRIQDLLPVLFAKTGPGIMREKRRIDNELEAYFHSEKMRSIGGKYTTTKPLQKGLSFTKIRMPYGKRSDVLLEGMDKRFYKGVESPLQITTDSGFKTTLQSLTSDIPSDTTASVPKIV